ncbi:hypothetical protein RYH73_18210 [Olivibacter sp. CPCC 100613]|uniref:hypothetical protein n=1 Tax=Olivibacter sp. CPCC 100613 TaxID=3079931 RepID=UPI002FF55D9C
MKFRELIHTEKDIAFIIGNGINRYPNNPNALSWEELLLKLWHQFSPEAYKFVPKGITITEFYDLLDLASIDSTAHPFQIQKKVSRLLKDWQPLDHHTSFVKWAERHNAPILTTNFDRTLSSLPSLRQFRFKAPFTDFYPWSTYFSSHQLRNPLEGFGIWFINGFVSYHRSIRLGLSHYMGSIEKARNYIYKGGTRNLFNSKNRMIWNGANTWLHILFNKQLCIFGLGLEENEIFIRWLLIERAKYYRKFPSRRKKAWYIVPKKEKPNEQSSGKMQFLQGIGINLIEAEGYPEIYEEPWQ